MPRRRNVDATEDVREVLASLGWQTLDAATKDTRGIHELAPTEKPVKRLSKPAASTHIPQGQKGWTISGVRSAALEKLEGAHLREEVEERFNARMNTILHAPEADEARRVLGQEDSDLLQKMEDTQDSLHSKRGVVKNKYDKLGVFSKNVNQVRANALYRVELRRRLQNNEIRRSRALSKKPGTSRDQLSLEAKLQNLLEDLSVLDGDADNVTSRSMDQTMASAMAQASVAAQRSAFLPPEVVEARRAEAQAAVTDMISRYRRNVEERRNQILLDMGIDPSAALENGTGAIAAAAYDNMLQTMEKEEVDRSIKVQSTTALVEAALARVETVTDRMAAMEQQAHDAAAAKAAEEERYNQRLSESYSRDDMPAGGMDVSGGASEAHAGPSSSDAPPTSAAKAAADQAEKKKAEEAAKEAAGAGARASPGPKKAAPGPAALPPGSSLSGEQVAEEKLKAMDKGKAPALPELIVDEGLSLAEQLQKRLERVWQLLRMPVMEKLDMVIKYTSKELSHSLEAALKAWEDAAAAVLARETALTALEELASRAPSSWGPATTDAEMAAAVEGLERATVFVVQGDRKLKSDFGDTLTFEGYAYCERKDEADWWTGGATSKLSSEVADDA